jgi:Gp49-like protein DUF891
MRPQIYEVEKFQFIPLTKQAEKFLRDLPERHWVQFTVAAHVLATALGRGVTPAGRSERITGFESGMFELKLNLPGSPGPQRRLICFREGRRILIVKGLEKRRRRLPPREVELAARDIRAYREKHADERPRKGKAKKRGKRAG